MNKVYVVMFNNGELREENKEWVDSVFQNKASALAYIRGRGYTECRANYYYPANTFSLDHEYYYIEEHILK